MKRLFINFEDKTPIFEKNETSKKTISKLFEADKGDVKRSILYESVIPTDVYEYWFSIPRFYTKEELLEVISKMKTGLHEEDPINRSPGYVFGPKKYAHVTVDLEIFNQDAKTVANYLEGFLSSSEPHMFGKNLPFDGLYLVHFTEQQKGAYINGEPATGIKFNPNMSSFYNGTDGVLNVISAIISRYVPTYFVEKFFDNCCRLDKVAIVHIANRVGKYYSELEVHEGSIEHIEPKPRTQGEAQQNKLAFNKKNSSKLYHRLEQSYCVAIIVWLEHIAYMTAPPSALFEFK